jgi:hypothetical protein
MILVEGITDSSFFKELIKQRGLQNFEVPWGEKDWGEAKQGGIGGFRMKLRALRIGSKSGIENFGLILLVGDNNGNPSGRFAEIQNEILEAEGFGIPQKPREIAASPGVDGLGNPLPPISILMLPWDSVDGNLESLCFISAANTRPQYAQCIEDYLACFGTNEWEVSQLWKLRMRCLLAAACPGDPNTGLEHAWSSQKRRPSDLVLLDHPCFNQVADYLASLP